MRPDAVEVLERVAGGLEQQVLPAVSDPVVHGQVAVMTILLRDLAAGWDEEADRLRATIARWEDRLEAMMAALVEVRDSAQRSDDLTPLVEHIGAVLADRTDSLGLRALFRRRAALAALLGEVLVTCERSCPEPDGPLAAVRVEAYGAVLGP